MTVRYGVYELQLLAPVFLAGAVCRFFFAAKILARRSFPKILEEPISRISGMTLNIYLVQFIIIDFCKEYAFPFGFLCAVALILCSAAILGRAVNGLRRIPEILRNRNFPSFPR